MTDDQNPFDGGSASGNHPVKLRLAFDVAPTTKEGFNTVRVPLVAIACWRLNHAVFDFDSSFVTPETREELALLAKVVKANPDSPLAVFGHADPTGEDEANKVLSGRRARAIYAVLRRNVSAWESLFSARVMGDSWGLKSTQRILAFLTREDDALPYLDGPADGAFGPATDKAIRAYQTDNGLTVDGVAGPKTRAALYAEYMDAICSDGEEPFALKEDAFILGGAGASTKGAAQGCGELNPVHLLSADERETLDAEARNALDAPNRRVMIFFFRPGTKVTRDDWPCPNWDEPGSGCEKALWPNGNERRENRDAPREYRNDRHTMACRFYDRLARTSPCEGVVLPVARIRLFDLDESPIPNATYEVSGEGFSIEGTSRDSYVVLRNIPHATTCTVKWSRPLELRKADLLDPDGELDDYEFETEIVIKLPKGDDETADRLRLANLGHGHHESDDEALLAFRMASNVEVTGSTEDVLNELRRRHDRCELPPKPEPKERA